MKLSYEEWRKMYIKVDSDLREELIKFHGIDAEEAIEELIKPIYEKYINDNWEYCTPMRRFTVYRRNAPETHNENQKNPPDMPQFEGVIFSDGTCAIRWLTAKGSTAVWNSFDDMYAIHGHPEYDSEIIFHD